MSGIDGVLSSTAAAAGISVPVLRLLLSLVMNVPLAGIYALLIAKHRPVVQHLFFLASGFGLGYFCFGTDVYYNVASIVFNWVLLTITSSLKAHTFGVAASFITQMAFLLWGYVMFSSSEQDIDWCVPQCVLCLRNIGLAFDLMDGATSTKELSKDQLTTRLEKIPSLLASLAHGFCFCGYMVGPQFTFRRYHEWITGQLYGESRIKPSGSVVASIKAFIVAIAYMAIVPPLCAIFTEKFLYTQEFQTEWPLWKRLGYVFICHKFSVMQFAGCWLLNEVGCILSGISFNGMDKNGNAQWDGLANAKMLPFETTTTLTGVITSFNINTNQWVGRYIFKRLKRFDNKDLSQMVALLFLAIWHGVYSGYFICFINEFFCVGAERFILGYVKVPPTLLDPFKGIGAKGPVKFLKELFLACTAFCCKTMLLSYSLIGFTSKVWGRTIAVYNSLYWCVHILVIGIWLISLFVKKAPAPTPVTNAATKAKDE